MPTVPAAPPISAVSDYDPFARVYDQWLARDFCSRILPSLHKLLLNTLSPHSHILDVCCGTGQMAQALTRLGHHITGIDSSPAMLRVAHANVPEAVFAEADVRHFRLDEKFDAAISTFNSLAHLETTADLTQAFSNIRHHLRPRASFLFDLSMDEAYRSKWCGSFGTVADDHSCIVRPSYDPDTHIGTNHITVFELRSQHWHRSDFTITQKCHSASEIRSALRLAGYHDVRSFDAQRDLGIPGDAGRSFFLCR